MSAPPPGIIVPEPDDFVDDDGDSAFGSDIASSTTSIGSSILKYREENGRTYHAYKDGRYVLPNDESENNRLDLQHHLLTLTFDGKLYTAPISKDKQLHRVLDVGTGTGIWAIDFGGSGPADEHPETQVIGIDLSPIQPGFVPPNLIFEIDDAEEPWTFSPKFDFIYTRMMTGSILDWPKLFDQCMKNLNPGGYVEVVDLLFPIRSDDGTVEETAVRKWADLMIESANAMNRVPDTAFHYKQQLIDAGFEDVTEVVYKWPQNRWPKDPKLKELGMWQFENLYGGLSGISMALFTRGLGWSSEEVEAFLVNVRKDMKNTKIHGYWPLYVVHGKKPEPKPE